MSQEIAGREHLIRRQQAMTAVFKRFAAVWPRAFAAASWPVLMETWLDNVRGIPDDVLEPAARALLQRPSSYPPKPWDFAGVARSVRDKHEPSTTRGRGPLHAWVWRSPVSGRLLSVEEHVDGWVWMEALDNPRDFLAMTDDGKRTWCEEMALNYGLQPERGAA